MKLSSQHLELSTVVRLKQFQETRRIAPRFTGQKFRGEIVTPWSKVLNVELSTVMRINAYNNTSNDSIQSYHRRKFQIGTFDHGGTISPQNFWPVVRAITRQIFRNCFSRTVIGSSNSELLTLVRLFLLETFYPVVHGVTRQVFWNRFSCTTVTSSECRDDNFMFQLIHSRIKNAITLRKR